MIDSQRLADRFVSLVEIDSIPREEKDVAIALEKILTCMGAEVCFDNAADMVGGNCSNLVARFKGTVQAEPIFLCAHMDTVEPGKGIEPVLKDGVFTSRGDTVLGADDKSAIAIILEVMDVVIERNLDYPPVEVVFTVCEEIGLLGAKYFDYDLINSKFGYILDSPDTEGIVTRAPASNKISIRVYGKAAHAGAAPENGVSAIEVASKAISGISLGRIDHETTCNLGTIQGGVATNIVPDFVEINGEARSHNPEKLEKVTKEIVEAFQKTAEEFADGSGVPTIHADVELDFPHTNIPDDHKVIILAQNAAENLGIPMKTRSTGGGADANIFFGHGLAAGVLGTGMTDLHTLDESIALNDMVKTGELVLEILKLHAEESRK